MNPACGASEVLPHLTLPVLRGGCQYNDDAGRLILHSGGGDRADARAAPLLGHNRALSRSTGNRVGNLDPWLLLPLLLILLYISEAGHRDQEPRCYLFSPFSSERTVAALHLELGPPSENAEWYPSC